jgi:hypothetical protein
MSTPIPNKLAKTARYSRHTYGDDGDRGRRNIMSVSFVATDLKRPVAASATALLAATAVSSTATSTLTPTTLYPDVPRNLTVTVAATTAADIAAGTITVTGKNVEGKTITEDFAVTADTAGALVGDKAFASVSSVAVPQQDGASVTVSLGVGSKLGIGMRNIASMPIKVLTRSSAGVEALEDASASAFSTTNVENNTVTTTTTLDGIVGLRVYVLNYKWAINPTNGQPDYGV